MWNFIRATKLISCITSLNRKVLYCPHNISPKWNYLQKKRWLHQSCFLLEESAFVMEDPAREPEFLGKEQNIIDFRLQKLDLDIKTKGRLNWNKVQHTYYDLKSYGSATNTQGLFLIRCCGSLISEASTQQRTELMENVWKTLLEMGCPIDVTHYNSLLRVYLENEHRFDPLSILSAMAEANIEPNQVTCQHLISRYCQDGNIEEASKILEFMKTKLLPINESIFNELIIGQAKSNNMTAAKKLLQVMGNFKLRPNSSTYCALACGYAINGDIESVLSTLEEACEDKAALSAKEVLHIFYILTVNNKAHLTEKIMPQLSSLGCTKRDLTNVILELVNRGYHETGFSLLNLMPRENLIDGFLSTGAFFIRQIVKLGFPAKEVFNYCSKLEDPELVTVALQTALETCQTDTAITILESFHNQGLEIRPHYFFPILMNKSSDSEKFGILKKMADLGCPADEETFMDYVFPHVATSDLEALVHRLQEFGYSASSTLSYIIFLLLSRNQLSAVPTLLDKFPVRLSSSIIKPQYLATALLKTGATSSLVKILKHMTENPVLDRQSPFNEDIVGPFMIQYLSADKMILEELLSSLKIQGLNISLEAHDKLISKFPSIINEKMLSILDSLVSPDLKFREGSPVKNPAEMNAEEIEASILVCKAKGLDYISLLRLLLYLSCKSQNSRRVEEIKWELDELGEPNNAPTCVYLFKFYCEQNNLDEALKYRNLLLEDFPNFDIHDYRIVNLATLLVSKGKFVEAERQLRLHFPRHIGNINPNIFTLLNTIANSGEVERTHLMLDLLLDCGYYKTNPPSAHISCLVQAHFAKNDIDGAVEEFMQAVRKYRCTPNKMKVLKALIQIADTARLQKALDAMIQIHGAPAALFSLGCAFIESNCPKQAEKIFQTPGFKVEEKKIKSTLGNFVDRKMINELQSFVSHSKDINHINRDMMYYYLLRAYVMEENVQKALDVHLAMQEEGVRPSKKTLDLLGTFLTRMNQPVPFSFCGTVDNPDSAQETRPEILDNERDRFPKISTSTVKSVNRSQMAERKFKQ